MALKSDHHGSRFVLGSTALDEEDAYYASRRLKNRNTLLRSEAAKAVWAKRKKVTLPAVKFLAGEDEE